ncbi:hypothetical protein H9P43_007410 [Blastocladiella emersonii ATCC 22665]|nr:hypothetical protein H9P43_007410 [Blastocladiella emersonii ATCC 22665]
MSTVYLGLAASAGAAAVYVGRRLSVKLGGDPNADPAAAVDAANAAHAAAKNAAGHDDLTEIVIDDGAAPASAADSTSGITRAVTPADPHYPHPHPHHPNPYALPLTPPATPVKPPHLQLETLDPITIPKPSGSEPPAPPTRPAPPLPPRPSLANIHAHSRSASAASLGAITETDDDHHMHHHARAAVRVAESDDDEDVREKPAAAAPAIPRRASNLNLAAAAFVPGSTTASPAASRSASPTGASETSSSSDPADKPKKIRCAYWPQCKYGGTCVYWHPLEKCKNEENVAKFPNGCVYGTRCFFYHDNEAAYLAAAGVFPPYQRSLGIGPNTPSSSPSVGGGGHARRLSASILPSQRSAPMFSSAPLVTPAGTAGMPAGPYAPQPPHAHALRKPRSMSMVLPPRPATGPSSSSSSSPIAYVAPGPGVIGTPGAPGTGYPAHHNGVGVGGSPRRMRSATHLRRASGSSFTAPAPAPASQIAAENVVAVAAEVAAIPVHGTPQRRPSLLNVKAPAFAPPTTPTVVTGGGAGAGVQASAVVVSLE